MPGLDFIKCSGCGACAQICPKSAISMKPNNEGFLYPEVDSNLCVECKLCEKTCPVLNVKSSAGFSERKTYAAICNDEKLRMKSSSGGMFTILAEKVINDGGVVFGAEFDSDFSVKHGWTDCVEGLERFRGSKYLQSRTENTFFECRKFLEDGRKVLYTGTPCQIAGLKSFLKKEYENLFTVDLICHGVPSPALWQKYIKFREKKSASRIVKTAFRQKNEGWKLFSLSFTFANDSEFSLPMSKDKYLCLFLKDNALRESCYRCQFRGDNHKSDLTVADFWGIENVLPDFFDDRGTSLVIIQNIRGESFFDGVKDLCRYKEVDFNEAIKSNPSYLKSSERSKKRDSFYKNFEKTSIDTLYKKYARDSFYKRAKNFVKRCIKFCLVKTIGEENFVKLKSRRHAEKIN